jgi:cyclopropane-fatty-acyl-phospholipid synthase
MWLLDKMLRRLIRKGRLIVTDFDGKVYEYGPGGGEAYRVRLTDKGAALHMAKDPRMGTGEAYMDGRLVVEPPHDIRDIVLFIARQASSENDPLETKGLFRRWFDRVAAQLDQMNSRQRSSKNAVHHYGLTRQFYELFLDEDRQYSMGFYRDPANSLERAQLDKKALVAAKLRLESKKDGRPLRVLDIGCGWGGLGLYFNRHYGCEVLGVSLAPDQVKFANERAAAAGVADKVKFELIDYRDVEGPFDRISSVGMFEHVGRQNFDEYFAKTNALLAPDGIMLTHTIGRLTPPPNISDKWSRTYIFPGHYLPSLSEMVGALERTRWEVADVEVLRYHYAHTLAEWYRRTTLHEKEITELYDARLFRMWQFYLAGAEQSFRGTGMVNFHVQSVKRRDAVPMTRDYIIHEAARLSAADEAPEWHLADHFRAEARDAAE